MQTLEQQFMQIKLKIQYEILNNMIMLNYTKLKVIRLKFIKIVSLGILILFLFFCLS